MKYLQENGLVTLIDKKIEDNKHTNFYSLSSRPTEVKAESAATELDISNPKILTIEPRLETVVPVVTSIQTEMRIGNKEGDISSIINTILDELSKIENKYRNGHADLIQQLEDEKQNTRLAREALVNFKTRLSQLTSVE